VIVTSREIQRRIPYFESAAGVAGQRVEVHAFDRYLDRQTALTSQLIEPLFGAAQSAFLDVARDLAKPDFRRCVSITGARQQVRCSRLVIIPAAVLQGLSSPDGEG
jgi:hypothetical protein